MTEAPRRDVSLLHFFAKTFRPEIARISTQILSDIRKAASHPDGHENQSRDQFFSKAAQAAAKNFIDLAEGHPGQERQIDELFTRIGYSEAQGGRRWDSAETALQVATRSAWQNLATFATDNDLSSQDLKVLTEALFEYIDLLRGRLAEGFELAARHGRHEEAPARARLVDLFLSDPAPRPGSASTLGLPESRLFDLAETAGWPVPEEVVVVVASYHGTVPVLPDAPTFLTRVEPGFVFVIGPTEEQEQLVGAITRADPAIRAAVSWPVPPAESGSALRWCQRALDLIQLGVIAPTPVVRCEDHATQLWLHAEPSMRQRLCQELLEPLLAETPNSRAILSETLLTWVESPDSAPAIAARLDVHPQTIRYRWKRINELFGESLRDPEFVVQVALVLKASVPMWKAGNQSDFERFRDRKEAHE